MFENRIWAPSPGFFLFPWVCCVSEVEIYELTNWWNLLSQEVLWAENINRLNTCLDTRKAGRFAMADRPQGNFQWTFVGSGNGAVSMCSSSAKLSVCSPGPGKRALLFVTATSLLWLIHRKAMDEACVLPLPECLVCATCFAPVILHPHDLLQ